MEDGLGPFGPGACRNALTESSCAKDYPGMDAVLMLDESRLR